MVKSFIDIDLVETGIVAFDTVLGGGLEKGDLVELSSESGVGKSTLLLATVRNLLSRGLRCAFLDVERGVKKRILGNMGLYKGASDVIGADFYIASPITFDEIDELFVKLILEEKYDFIVVDSITSVLPAKLREKAVAEIEIGLESRQTSSLLKKWKPELRDAGSILALVNQMRTKMSGKGRFMHVTTDSAGGQALRFMPDVRIRLANGPRISRNEDTVAGVQEVVYGNWAWLWNEKNRNERSFIKHKMPIIYGLGVSNVLTLIEIFKIREAITGGAGGHWKLAYKGGQEKLRTPDLHAFVKSNFQELKDFARDNGWLSLTAGEQQK